MTNRNLSVSVWNLFVRVIHLSFIVILPLLYWTAHEGLLNIHQYLGIGLLLLVFIRIVWGLFTSSYGRFGHFLYHPRVVLGYLTSLFHRRPSDYLSHNPAGGYMVALLLALMLSQGLLGLFSMDDVIFEGPLTFLIDTELAERITGWHRWLFNAILGAIGLHITAVFWYQIYKRQPLIQSMIHGRKPLTDTQKDRLDTDN